MAPIHRPLIINRTLASSLDDIQTAVVKDEAARQALGVLLQSALQLEFATIPPYLTAAFSLHSSNEKVRDLIVRVAVEEMLHMMAVANLMNAIGVAPRIVDAVPVYPCDLTVLDPPLRLDLKSFSLDLVQRLFMRIEAPEDPVVYPMDTGAAARPRTIGQFYEGIIEIIESDTIPGLFKDAERDLYKQRSELPIFSQVAYANNDDTYTYPLRAEIDFRITDKVSAVRHLSWVVDQGEGSAPFDPLTNEGLPGHYYRFESILKSRFLVKDNNPPLNHSFSGGDLPFDQTGVDEFDVNAKIADYAAFPAVQNRMKRFVRTYTSMVDLLQKAFNCPDPQQQAEAEADCVRSVNNMRNLRNLATGVISEARENGIKGGLPFEYTPSPTV